MSSRHLLVLMALTSILVVPGAASQLIAGDSLADLLLRDEIEKAEARLAAVVRKTAETVAFEGEIEYRKGHFDKAENLYSDAIRMDDKTARAHFGLGKLAMAKLRTKDAVQLFSKAIELDAAESLYRLYVSDALLAEKKPAEAEKHLREYLRMNPPDPDRVTGARAGVEVLSALKGTEAGAIDSPPQPSPINFQSLLNLLFTEVSINGSGPYRFVIDTGATQTVLSDKLASQLGLKPITSTVMHGVGGAGKVDTFIYRLEQLKVGEVVVKNLPVGTFDNPMVTQLADGILGTATLSDFVITIDYPGSRMELSHRAPESAKPISVWCVSNLLLVPLEVNGHQANFLVDTGAVSTVLSHRMAKTLGVTEDTPGARLSRSLGGVGGLEGSVLLVPRVSLKISNESRYFDEVISINLQDVSRMIQTEISGILGYDFLKDYKLTLDYYKAEIRLSK